MNYSLNKEASKSLIQFISVSWLAFIALAPYFLVAMALIDFNARFGLSMFDALLGYVGIPFGLVIILLLFKSNLLRVDPLKEFVARNAKKVFTSGVIVFYLTGVISIIININSAIPVLMLVFFSFFAFPVMWIMLKLGFNLFKRINESIKDV